MSAGPRRPAPNGLYQPGPQLTQGSDIHRDLRQRVRGDIDKVKEHSPVSMTLDDMVGQPADIVPSACHYRANRQPGELTITTLEL
jgi:hypothetical protein